MQTVERGVCFGGVQEHSPNIGVVEEECYFFI